MGAKLSGAGGVTIKQNADINVTPFVDIMLVLLIIFMVAAPMATVSIRLDLPPGEESEPQEEPVYISVQKSGLFIGERESSPETLSADVCAALGGADCTSQRIFVRAEADVRYERFMGVMNDLYGAGFTQVGLLNEDIT